MQVTVEENTAYKVELVMGKPHAIELMRMVQNPITENETKEAEEIRAAIWNALRNAGADS